MNEAQRSERRVDRPVSRRPLNRGNRYCFRGYARNGFRVLAVCLRGHPDDDGGFPGVAIQWLRLGDRSKWFYPCDTEAEFWADLRFANACDPEAANAGNNLRESRRDERQVD